MAWIIQNNHLVNTDAVGVPDTPFHGDSPYTFWRIDPNANEGMPYVGLMIGVPVLNPEPPPEPVQPVYQREYITVHDMRTAQSDFDNHGLCILDPTECRVTEELNGEYSAYLEHPIDEWGKWENLLEMNFLKIRGQLFYIYKVNHTFNGSEGKVKVWARHIFYLLNDRWIYSGTGAAYWVAKTLMQLMYSIAEAKPRETDIIYTYSMDSDLPDRSVLNPVSYIMWGKLKAGMSFTEFIMGSGGFIDKWGYTSNGVSMNGELHRDNFYFSVNQRKEGTKDKAFEIRVGLNLRGITREIDTSQLCTYLTGKDTFGNKYSIATTGSSQTYPHHIVREVVFNYDEANVEQLEKDTKAQFRKYSQPKVTYTVNLYDVRFNPDYQNLTEYPEFKVGNKGYIYDERLNRIIGDNHIELKITKTVIDGITGEVLEVVFGEKKSITRPPQSDSTPLSKEKVEQLVNETQAAARTLGTWNAVYNYTWGELARFTWNQCNGSPT